jgi:hypothetical protein
MWYPSTKLHGVTAHTPVFFKYLLLNNVNLTFRIFSAACLFHIAFVEITSSSHTTSSFPKASSIK